MLFMLLDYKQHKQVRCESASDAFKVVRKSYPCSCIDYAHDSNLLVYSSDWHDGSRSEELCIAVYERASQTLFIKERQ